MIDEQQSRTDDGAQRTSEERAADAEAQLKDASRRIAVLAHDLRTAIGGIISVAGLLADSELREEQRKQVAALQQSGNDLLGIVNNVLDDARLRTGRLELDPIDTDFAAFLAAVEQNLKARAALKGLNAAVTVQGAMPASMRVDANRLRQIVDNLIDNAVKFTSRGGIHVTFDFADGDAEDGLLTIKVADTGIGLSQDQLSRLFVPFAQADRTIARRFGGSGLGLAIVKQLVALMAGTIGVTSELDKGTTFTVSLPVAGVAWTAERDSDAPRSAGKLRQPQQSVHVLIVEDNAVNQFLLSTLLQSFGMSYEIASNGREGIRTFKRGHFDVVLMDIQMPGVDGIEATRTIRAGRSAGSGTPIIALTAQMTEDLDAAYAEGLFDAHVSKPIDPARLAGAINEVLQERTVFARA